MGIFKKSAEPNDASLNDPDAPWANAAQAYEHTFLRQAAQVGNWRRFAFICLGIAALAVSGVIYIGAQSKFQPLLVEVDKLGRTVAVRALNGNDAIMDARRVVYSEVFELIENLRTVTTDRAANNARLEKGFSRLKGSGLIYVKTELKKAPPNEVGATKTVEVQVKSALKVTERTWQVEWTERSISLAGEEISAENWKATFQVELTPSGDESVLRRNPIGFTVPEINWTKVI